MPNPTKWTIHEEKILRQFAQKQQQKNYVSWEEMASAINRVYKTNKTARQCRQRYMNYVRFDESNPLINNWTQEQNESFYKLYLERGSAWSYLSTLLTNKSQNCLKNKFNSSLKDVTKLLYYKKSKFANTICLPANMKQFKDLTILLRTSNQIIGFAQFMKLQINYQSLLFRFRKTLIRMCFKPYLFSSEQVDQFKELIDVILQKFKDCMIFKIKSKKLIKSKKILEQICEVDDIIKDHKITPQDYFLNQNNLNNLNVKAQEYSENLTKIKVQAQIDLLNQKLFNNQGYYQFYQTLYTLNDLKIEY